MKFHNILQHRRYNRAIPVKPGCLKAENIRKIMDKLHKTMRVMEIIGVTILKSGWNNVGLRRRTAI